MSNKTQQTLTSTEYELLKLLEGMGSRNFDARAYSKLVLDSLKKKGVICVASEDESGEPSLIFIDERRSTSEIHNYELSILNKADSVNETVLSLPAGKDGFGERITLGDMLVELLALVWRQGEYFDEKVYFRDKGWRSDIHVSLFKAGLIEGSLDDMGGVDWVDRQGANDLVGNAIYSLFDSSRSVKDNNIINRRNKNE